MKSEIEKARQLFKSLELKSLSREERVLRVLCIQELLEDTRNKIEIKIRN